MELFILKDGRHFENAFHLGLPKYSLMKKPTLFLFLFFCGGLLNAQWTQVGSDIDGEAALDGFGWSVSLCANGTRVAIGAVGNDGNGNDSGHVRIYEEVDGTWSQIGSDINGEAAQDESGFSVSLSSDGTRVAIGAIFNDGNGTSSGHVRVFKESGGVWSQIGSDIDGEAAGDYSGRSVSLSSSGHRVAIGAFRNDGNGIDAGHVRVFEESGGIWLQVGSDIDGEEAGDFSGFSVSLSHDGTRVAIGAILNDGNGNESGHVRIFEELGDVWSQVGNDIDGEEAEDQSGFSVSLSSDGSLLSIGARFNDGNGDESGHVRVYEDIDGVWSQVGNDINGEAAFDLSGSSVSLSPNGNRVAIGAILNDINGIDVGHVRVYGNSGGIWSQAGSDIDGEEDSEQFGISVSLSATGRRVAVGAFQSSASGHVRVYDDVTLTAVIPVGLEGRNGFYIKSVFADQKQLSVTYNLPFYNNIIATLYDLNGRIISNDKKFSSKGLNTLILDIGGLPTGVYVVNLWNGQRQVSEKFVSP